MKKNVWLSGVLATFLLACGNDHSELPPVLPAFQQQPSPAYLSPEESMKTIHVPPGYHLQLVASEPQIQEPVAMVWDGNGNMYVAEMRSYMMDINGTGEHFPICRISRLTDTDGDGKMDKVTVFIDSLVLPRMMLCLDDRLIVNETYVYNMYSYRDTNGDGIADEKKLVYHNDTADNANLEHQKSGLIWNLDNWIYVTANPVRYRWTNDQLVADTMDNSPGGQWGLANDNEGRLYYSAAGGEVPALNFQQNPVYGQLNIKGQMVDSFEQVWPIIGTPDVQGGQHRLRPDSTLNHFTACCGQTVYRGDRLPASMLGDLFICEPVGRLIRRAKVTNQQGERVLSNVYNKAEFLVSTDMNFRPVNTATGPDGCLYIADMYHGIIQESNWTKEGSYLRPQILRKELDKNIGRGRIYRLVHDDYKPGPTPQLLNATSAQLVETLSHPNGWWRENAQKLLILRNDPSVIPALKQLAFTQEGFWDKLQFWKKSPSPYARLQALWTLEGMKALDKEEVKKAYTDKDPAIRASAIRLSEPWFKQDDAGTLAGLEPLKNDSSADVRQQWVLSLRYSKQARAKDLIKEITARYPKNELLEKMAKKSLEGDVELKYLNARLVKFNDEDKHLIRTGAVNFSQLCATCHGPQGTGLPTQVAPLLAGSSRVNGPSDKLIALLLKGLSGPVDGKTYPDVMPAMQANNDEYIASVLSYIRNVPGNQAGAIRPPEVKRIRDSIAARDHAWTLQELEKPAKK